MKTATQQITDYLEEAQGIVKAVEREGRQITKAERARAEFILEQVQGLKDTEALTEAINKMNGSLNLGGFPSKSRGVPALDFSLKTIQDMHSAAQSGHFIKAAIDSAEVPQSEVGDYKLTPFPFLRDKPRVANLIPVERTDGPTVFYFRGSTAASAAAAVAQGAAKPESSPVWTQVSSPVRKLAHYVRINDEVLQDFVNFRQVIGTELLAGLIDAENGQLLTGSGVDPNLTGLLTTSGILTRARATDSNRRGGEGKERPPRWCEFHRAGCDRHPPDQPEHDPDGQGYDRPLHH